MRIQLQSISIVTRVLKSLEGLQRRARKFEQTNPPAKTTVNGTVHFDARGGLDDSIEARERDRVHGIDRIPVKASLVIPLSHLLPDPTEVAGS